MSDLFTAKMDDGVEEYDLVFNEHKFRLKSEDGETRNYVLVELDGVGRNVYMKALSKKVKTVVNGKPSEISDLSEMQVLLLSLATKEIKDDGSRESVHKNVLQSWPSSLLAKLEEKALEISGLNKEDDKDEDGDEAKNE